MLRLNLNSSLCRQIWYSKCFMYADHSVSAHYKATRTEQIGLIIGKSVSWLVILCMTRHERTSSERVWEDYWPAMNLQSQGKRSSSSDRTGGGRRGSGRTTCCCFSVITEVNEGKLQKSLDAAPPGPTSERYVSEGSQPFGLNTTQHTEINYFFMRIWFIFGHYLHDEHACFFSSHITVMSWF